MNDKISKENTILNLSGSSYDIGLKHGEKAKKQVHNSLQTYERMFKEFAGTSWNQAREKALLHVKEIEKYNPNYIDEMDGLANGAGVTFEDILTLNARSEIVLINTTDGCTSFALINPRKMDTWLAQNWDWKGNQVDSLIHLHIKQNDLPSIQMITEAGIIGKIGCNDKGVGVCLNALVTDTWQPKVPIHLGLRAVLESNSMEEAISRVKGNQMASSAHFLIASKSEEILSIEVSPVHTAKRKTNNGLLTHTNHICDEEMKRKVEEEALPDSFERFAKVTNLLEKLNDKEVKKENLFRVLCNHDSYPNSICRHNSSVQIGREKMETVFSIVMNLSDNELTWIRGKPCEHY
ncbi:C45 family autoproteolytic acyltransferase/hydolase [Alteribacter populi]|uniref:C45 family autoproteolytic acyltransferase/hydolase n=1 Tax=Alteribacter populi TaxID=2011011 RepID=UPI001FE1A0D4|nr:C45 family peptidase [Alteribacter populi]